MGNLQFLEKFFKKKLTDLLGFVLQLFLFARFFFFFEIYRLYLSYRLIVNCWAKLFYTRHPILYNASGNATCKSFPRKIFLWFCPNNLFFFSSRFHFKWNCMLKLLVVPDSGCLVLFFSRVDSGVFRFVFYKMFSYNFHDFDLSKWDEQIRTSWH